MAGGGSGGHITPLLAVAKQLKNDHPKAYVAIISEKRGLFNHLLEGDASIDSLRFINAGKYRRYHGQSFFNKLFDVKSIALNFRDVFRLSAGIIESIYILFRFKPDIVFIKGGYVGVPVGVAARLMKIPYITHDSDAVPGLTNRLIAKQAVANTVGMPVDFYPYRKDKVVFVGVPVTEDFIHHGPKTRLKKRDQLDISPTDFLLLITGGSNGAQRLDELVHKCLEQLLEKHPRLHIIHQVGKSNENIYNDYPVKLHTRIRVASFLKPLSEYISAADAVVARAGATAIAEIGHLKKPLIVVPNSYLSGGHQTKNADVLSQSNAAIVVVENQAIDHPELLIAAIDKIMGSADLADKLSDNLHQITLKDSTQRISNLLVELIHQYKK